MEDWEEDSPMRMEEKLEETYIKQQLKDISRIDGKKIGLCPQVKEEKKVY